MTIRRHVRTLVVLGTAIATWAVPLHAAAPPYRLFVYTTHEGTRPTDEERDREDSVRDLVKILGDAKYGRLVLLVDDEAVADVLLEVEWRGSLEVAQTIRISPGVGGRAGSPASQARMLQNNLRVILRTSRHSQEFYGIEPGKRNWMGNVEHRTWTQLARHAAEQVVQWLDRNPERVPDDGSR